MRTLLKCLVWTCALVTVSAGAHGPEPSKICGDGTLEVVDHFKFDERMLSIYEHCIKDQSQKCASGGGLEVMSVESGLECRPQYCTELAMNLPLNTLKGPENQIESCGVVDDAWGRATHMATDYCAGHVPVGSAKPRIFTPATYLDATDHHTLYTSDQGLQGDCVRCTSPSQ